MKYQELYDYIGMSGTWLDPNQLEKIAEIVREADRKERLQSLTVEKAREILCENFATNPGKLNLHCRHIDVILTRHALDFLCVRHFKMSTPKTGAINGGRGHSSVLNGMKAFENHWNSKRDFRNNMKVVFDQMGLNPASFKELVK